MEDHGGLDKDTCLPTDLAKIVRAGCVTWADDCGESALPGLERTRMPDEEIREINLVAIDGSHYEVNPRLLKPAWTENPENQRNSGLTKLPPRASNGLWWR